MTDPKPPEVNIPDLTDEQMAALRKRFQAEQQVVEQSAAGTAQGDPDLGGDKVYTNISSEGLIIPDLGIGTGIPGQIFTPEYFQPHETKNLGELYSAREIKRSKHLTLFITKHKKIVRGVVPLDQHIQNKDPLAALAETHADSPEPFTDPARVPLNSRSGPIEPQTEYDQKLKDLRDRDAKEELETRQSD